MSDMELLPRIKSIHSEKVQLNEPFDDFARRFSHIPGTVVLLSGGDLDCARYHILGTNPWLSVSARHDEIKITTGDTIYYKKDNPFDILSKLVKTCHLDESQIPGFDPDFPIVSGLLGYLSYDLKDCLEVLPRTSIDRSGLPHMLFFAPSILVVYDKVKKSTTLIIPELETTSAATISQQLDFFNRVSVASSPNISDNKIITGLLKSNFKKENYVQIIKSIIEYIASGHVYQVNMSQRFEADFQGNPYLLFKNYYQLNPAPFFAYINAGDHQIVSTSPERFLARNKKQVESRPIKGTRPRGKTPEEDQQLREKLFNSKKDDAELSMIVDLMRNDIGKVCEGGSVSVAEHRRVEAYQNVYHLVSIVRGTLDTQYDSVDLIRATFPGGSITGCPKIRSMEIIDEFEPDRRHIYTGSIGYISFHDTMDLSIAIRTATIYNSKLTFSVGGGIVFDSDPQKEFEETLHKGQTLMSAFDTNNLSAINKDIIWFNGTLVPADTAGVPINDLGFQYGYGFFETIRADKGKATYLKAHIERFENTWAQLFNDPVPDLTWDVIIEQVLVANQLDIDTAAVKIIATKGNRDAPPYNHGLIVTARPYIHRLDDKKDQGFHLATYPYPRQTPLANHKTLNYLYYYLAGKWAKDNGKDEALILNTNGSISETNTGSLILIDNTSAVLPKSPAVLPGTMQNTVIDILKKWDYKVESTEILLKDIFSYGEVVVTNALMGAVPALSIDGKTLTAPSDLWERINAELF